MTDTKINAWAHVWNLLLHSRQGVSHTYKGSLHSMEMRAGVGEKGEGWRLNGRSSSHISFLHSYLQPVTPLRLGECYKREKKLTPILFSAQAAKFHFYTRSTNTALWVKPCWKVEIGEFTKMSPSGPIFMNLNYFRHNIWRFSSVQFHFWYMWGLVEHNQLQKTDLQ